MASDNNITVVGNCTRDPELRFTPSGQAVATFVELAPPVSSGAAECILELENAGGAKMRIHLKGVVTPDLVALSRSFWSSEA